MLWYGGGNYHRLQLSLGLLRSPWVMPPVRDFLGSPPGAETVMGLDWQLAGMAGSFACIAVTVGLRGAGFDWS